MRQLGVSPFVRGLSLGTLAFLLPGTVATAATPDAMMATCRQRAAKSLQTPLPGVSTKYEGQRTDGTHAVNGAVGDRTFQCSFNKAGSRIVRFVATPDAAAAAPAASQRMPTKNEQACLAAVSRETNNGDVILLGSEASQASDFVRIGVGAQRAPWKCLVKDGKVAEVSSLGN